MTPEHDVTVPLTRMLAGPLDYHQGTLRGVPLEQFKPRVAAPLVIGTPSRMLASYVVLQNHLPMMADYPSAYRRHPLTRVMAAVPATWDDTRALAAQVGEEVVIARRSGNDWWIGAMTDRHAREVRVSLSFLPPGMFRAEIYQDDLAAEHGFRRETREVTPADELSLPARRSGRRTRQVDTGSRTAAQVAAGVERRLRHARPGQMGADRHQSTRRTIRCRTICRSKSASRTASWKSCPRTSRRADCRIAPVKSSVDGRSGWGDGKCGPNCRARGACGPRSGCCPMGRGRPGRDRHHGESRQSADDHVERVSLADAEPGFTRLFRNRAADGDRRPARIVSRRFSHLRLRVGRQPAAVLRRRRAPRDVLQRRGGILPAETLRADATGHQHGDRRRLPAAPGRDDGLAAAIARRLGPRLRARRGTGHSDVQQRRLRRQRRLAGRLARLRQSHRRQTECARASRGGAQWHARVEDLRSGDRRGQLFRRDPKHQRRRRRAGACKALGVRAFAGGSDRSEGPRVDENRVLQPLGRLLRRPGDARSRRAGDCRRGDADRCLARLRTGSGGARRRGRGPADTCLRPGLQRAGSGPHRRGRVLERIR